MKNPAELVYLFLICICIQAFYRFEGAVSHISDDIILRFFQCSLDVHSIVEDFLSGLFFLWSCRLCLGCHAARSAKKKQTKPIRNMMDRAPTPRFTLPVNWLMADTRVVPAKEAPLPQMS